MRPAVASFWTAVLLLALPNESFAQPTKPATGFGTSDFGEMNIEFDAAVCFDAAHADELRMITTTCIEDAISQRLCEVRPYNVNLIRGTCSSTTALSLPFNTIDYVWIGAPPTVAQMNNCAALALQRTECLALFQENFPEIKTITETALPITSAPTTAPTVAPTTAPDDSSPAPTEAPTEAPALVIGGIVTTDAPVSGDDGLSTSAIIGMVIGIAATVIFGLAVLVQRASRENPTTPKAFLNEPEDIGDDNVVAPALSIATVASNSSAWALADDLTADKSTAHANTTLDTMEDVADDEVDIEHGSHIAPPSRVMSHRLGIAPPPLVLPRDDAVTSQPTPSIQEQRHSYASSRVCDIQDQLCGVNPLCISPSGDSKTLFGEALVEDASAVVSTTSLDEILDAEDEIDQEQEMPDRSLLGSFDGRAKWDSLVIPQSPSQEEGRSTPASMRL